MEASVKLYGLEESLKAIEATFPNDQRIRARIINGAIGMAARKTLLPMAKQLADQGDDSGALSESLAVRAMGKRKRGPRPWGMELVPVRDNVKAIAKYLAFYERGTNVILSGIRHGHLVEFGFMHKSGAKIPATPFLWPAAEAMSGAYRIEFAKQLKRKFEQAVRAARKKGLIK